MFRCLFSHKCEHCIEYEKSLNFTYRTSKVPMNSLLLICFSVVVLTLRLYLDHLDLLRFSRIIETSLLEPEIDVPLTFLLLFFPCIFPSSCWVNISTILTFALYLSLESGYLYLLSELPTSWHLRDSLTNLSTFL